ncbi:sensor histidine kinase [Negadavirga shengliensis]|uniref:Sensor histidine kinase n=1 Tax=Negadavirga shengliensis TaxID=1389218 RepID=A0ABV9SZF1_9BACT
MAVTILVYGTYCAVASFIIIFIFVYVQGNFSLDAIPWALLLEHTQLPVTLGLSFMAFFTARSWLFEWRNAAIEAEQLKSENLASRYQSLKDQLNPHFLFNSLNVLSHLVYENADKSVEFIQQLSRIYRYVLDIQGEELVSLDRELEFAKSYLCLQKIRLGTAMDYHIAVPHSGNLYLPPLSLQLLLENAFKHNVASTENPLLITISIKGQNLVISNNLQRKKTGKKEKNGIGLNNITKRYALISSVSPSIRESTDIFLVELPLLKTDVFSKIQPLL